jgi:hypothetical protein
VEWSALSGGLEPNTHTFFGLGVVNLGTIVNGGDYRVRGLEISGMARVGMGLTIEAGDFAVEGRDKLLFA